MKEIVQPGNYSYLFSRYLEPIAHVEPGETVSIFTKDAFENELTEDMLPSQLKNKYANPLTGPVFINGAGPGDTLSVTILSIEAQREYALSTYCNNFGGFVSTEASYFFDERIKEKTWAYHHCDGMYRYNEKMCYPSRPFLGTIGTSPELEALTSLLPSRHGGNMDVRDVCPGNTLYLPVMVEGAYFYTGDCHANQGDGELIGVGLEIPAKAILRFDLIKRKKINWPRIENNEMIMTVGSARPMEDAARIAYCELIRWMEEDFGWDKLDAYQALTQIGKMYVGNMVDPSYSMVAGIEKKYL